MVAERCELKRRQGFGYYLRIVGSAIDHALGGKIPDWTRGSDGKDLGLRIKAIRIRNSLIRGLEECGVIVDDEVIVALGKSDGGVTTLARGHLLKEFYDNPEDIFVDPRKSVILEAVIPQDQFGLYRGRSYRAGFVFPADCCQPPSLVARFIEGREEIKKDPKAILNEVVAYSEQGIVFERLTLELMRDLSSNFYPEGGIYQYTLPL